MWTPFWTLEKIAKLLGLYIWFSKFVAKNKERRQKLSELAIDHPKSEPNFLS
jgi:hypothetical protein